MQRERISASEAAARLGVKRETIYAYVSRGLLDSHRAIDGKSSTFDPAEVARLRSGRAGRKRGRLDVPVTSGITDVVDGRVAYRGRTLADLVDENAGFEQVAELLWTGSLPPHAAWSSPAGVTKAARRSARALPIGSLPTDRIMAAVIASAAADPFRDDRSPSGSTSAAASLLTSMVESLPAVGTAPPGQVPLAQQLWHRLTANDDIDWPLLDLALVLLADHGMATSTLAARLAASTRGGIHPVVMAGLGTVVGPLHGGASRVVHHMFCDAAERGADSAIAEVLRRDERIPGLGHLIHKTADPRHDLLFDALGESKLDPERSDVVASVISRVSDRYIVAPNIDMALGAFAYMAGMDGDAGEVIFAIARTAGWIAHALEEYEEQPLRFRPVGRYSGPTESSS